METHQPLTPDQQSYLPLSWVVKDLLKGGKQMTTLELYDALKFVRNDIYTLDVFRNRLRFMEEHKIIKKEVLNEKFVWSL